MTGILVSLGERDRLTVDGLACVAACAGVAPETVLRVDRLCEQALEGGGPSLARLFDGDDTFVVGCSRPRTARALLDLGGSGHRVRQVTWLALPFDREALKTEYGVPWYPVIDRSRCSGCGTCAEYCLFSVYALQASEPAAERVRVAAPLNCKTGCPACARLCPEGALIFPFCPEAELNGEIEEPVRRTPDALAARLGDDPMRVLAERREQKRLLDPSKFQAADNDRVRYSGVL